MATPRLFKLKSQVAAAPTGPLAGELSYARVWVDTGVFHLDAPFDYQVPEDIADEVKVGVRVQVAFGQRQVEGLVIERVQSAQARSKFKAITKVLSPHPVATIGSLQLIEAVANRWASNPWEIIKNAIPARVASVDKGFLRQDVLSNRANATATISYVALEPYVDPCIKIVDLAIEAVKKASVLIIAPDEADIELLDEILASKGVNALRIDSAIARSERYAAFLTLMRTDNQIVLGARNAIFAPLPLGSTIIVVKESSPSFYEVRNPGWNVRDIALMRTDIDRASVVFTGYVPSLDVAALIEAKKIKYINTNAKIAVKSFSSEDSSLLPGRIFADIRSGLKDGAVLFVLPRKGYANGILCAHCKNTALCPCGGPLHLINKDAQPNCRICGAISNDWSCSYCKRDKKYIVSRGIDRAAEEISKAFPSYPIILSFGDVIKKRVEAKRSIILSTPGAAPHVQGGYSAGVILEGMSYFNHDDLRANERASELFFETVAMLKPGGVALLSIDGSHPIVSSLIRWNPVTIVKRELAQRSEISFPPSVDSAVLTIPTAQASALAIGINKAVEDLRLPANTRVLGPTKVDATTSKIVILSSTDSRNTVTGFLHELMRRRSIAKKADSTLRINPYSL